jgi:hypothetical protein
VRVLLGGVGVAPPHRHRRRLTAGRERLARLH